MQRVLLRTSPPLAKGIFCDRLISAGAQVRAPRMTAVGPWQQDVPICVNFLVLQNLDFDFEKCCSVTLSPINVYVCLVCGKYFQVG